MQEDFWFYDGCLSLFPLINYCYLQLKIHLEIRQVCAKNNFGVFYNQNLKSDGFIVERFRIFYVNEAFIYGKVYSIA